MCMKSRRHSCRQLGTGMTVQNCNVGKDSGDQAGEGICLRAGTGASAKAWYRWRVSTGLDYLTDHSSAES
jgi:hypothetical protein